MITLNPARPNRYTVLVIQVFSAAYGGWCDYRELRDDEDQDATLGMLATVHQGYRFRLVRRHVSDEWVAGSID